MTKPASGLPAFPFRVKNDGGFSPEKTFTCGQCFRFDKIDGADGFFGGVAGGRVLTVGTARSEKDGGEELLFSCEKEEFDAFWKHYLALDADPPSAPLSADPLILAAFEGGRGIRLLRQEGFEALASFILSQCNNIPRIKGIVERLCALFGEELSPGFHAFPTPETIASLSLEELAPLRAGYRTPYLLEAARRVASGGLDLGAMTARAGMPVGEARARLVALPGVGVKVADCVLLYGLGHGEAFPVDVWMKRALARLMPGFDPADHGQNAGYVQQVLFHYMRGEGRAAKEA